MNGLGFMPEMDEKEHFRRAFGAANAQDFPHAAVLFAGHKKKPENAVFSGFGASGDTELFEKSSDINGFRLSGNRFSCL